MIDEPVRLEPSAAPAPLTVVMRDANSNGRVDQVTLTLSETVATYSAGTSPWTLSSVPSSGTLSAVAASGTTATLTIVEGTGALDTAVGPFTVAVAASATGMRDAAGNQSTFTRSPSDAARPIVSTTDMFDVDVDGRIDRVTALFSEPLAAYSAGTGVWTLTSAPSGATLASVEVAGSLATLQLTQGTGAATTAVGSFRTTLVSNAAGIRDAAGNLASYAARAPIDRAAPVLQTLSLIDNNTNGKVDRVTAVFSESLTTYTAGIAPWTVLNASSGATLSAASVSSATATLTLTEGAGAADTTVASTTVRLSASATGVRDSAGNLASFGDRTPLDRARPTIIGVTDTNGAADGRVAPGDTATFTFSERLDPATVPASTSVVLADPSGTGSDTVTLAGILSGARSTGTDSHITLDAGSVAFDGSTVTLGSNNTTITVTVGPTCTGTACSNIGQATSSTTFSVVAAPTIADLFANTAGTSARSISIRLF